MDSALCERVSWRSYDGALASAAATAGRALRGVAPGVVSYPVEHAGCSVRSVQEAQAVVDCVRELLGREWVPAADAEPRPLTAEDCIVVAAYNAQVDCVREPLVWLILRVLACVWVRWISSRVRRLRWCWCRWRRRGLILGAVPGLCCRRIV